MEDVTVALNAGQGCLFLLENSVAPEEILRRPVLCKLNNERWQLQPF